MAKVENAESPDLWKFGPDQCGAKKSKDDIFTMINGSGDHPTAIYHGENMVKRASCVIEDTREGEDRNRICEHLNDRISSTCEQTRNEYFGIKSNLLGPPFPKKQS